MSNWENDYKAGLSHEFEVLELFVLVGVPLVAEKSGIESLIHNCAHRATASTVTHDIALVY